MKQNLKLSGEVELSQDEAAQAMLEYLRKEKKLFDAMENFLSSKYGYKPTKVAHSTDDNGKITVVCEVNQITNEGAKRPFVKSKSSSGEKRQPTGFKRQNVGFYRELTNYLNDERKKKRKELPFSEAFEDMKFLFPTLTERNFVIYASDKRQQKSKGFRYDGKRRMFVL